MLQAIAQKQIPFSFILGNSKDDALESLPQIKDSMDAILVIHSEDEMAFDQRTVNYGRMFYRGADYQYRELLGS